MKSLFFDDLNKDQLSGMANLCFDIAKVAYVLVVIPAQNITNNPPSEIIRAIMSIITGLAFTCFALILLKLKEEVKK